MDGVWSSVKGHPLGPQIITPCFRPPTDRASLQTRCIVKHQRTLQQGSCYTIHRHKKLTKLANQIRGCVVLIDAPVYDSGRSHPCHP
jgi:hypothetical protein